MFYTTRTVPYKIMLLYFFTEYITILSGPNWSQEATIFRSLSANKKLVFILRTTVNSKLNGIT